MVEEFKYSLHALDMMLERGIAKKWVESTLAEPTSVDHKGDGTRHYSRPIADREGRYLRVIVNPEALPKTIITTFFDRRSGRKL